jgi:hypothetical protein
VGGQKLSREATLSHLKLAPNADIEAHIKSQSREAGPPAKTVVSLRFPNGIYQEISFYSGTPLATVRHRAADALRAPTEFVKLSVDGRPVSEKDLGRPVSEYPNLDVVNSGPLIAVKVHQKSPEHALEIRDVSLLDRVYDLRLKIAEIRGCSLHDFRLYFEHSVLRDRASLASLGFYKGIEIQSKKATDAKVRLTFVDLNGRTIGYEVGRSETLDSIARYFHEEPAEVAFEFEGVALPRATSVLEVSSDPDRPITVVLRTLRVEVRYRDEPTFCDVTGETTAVGLVEILRPSYPQSMHLSLKFNGRGLQNENILELIPELDRPLELVMVPRGTTAEDLQSYVFSFPDLGIPDFMQILPRYGTAAAIGKDVVASKLPQKPGSAIGLYRNGVLLSDDDILYDEGPYQVRSGNYRNCMIALCPEKKPGKVPLPFQRSIQFPIGKSDPTVGDLVAHLASTWPLPKGLVTTLSDGKNDLPGAKKLKDLSVGVFHALLPKPCKEAHYSFRRQGPLAGMWDRALLIPDVYVKSSWSVRHLKRVIGKSLPRVLPDAIELAFWSVKLADAEHLLSYGIPDGSTIDFYASYSLHLQLSFSDGRPNAPYLVSHRTRIQDLKQYLAAETGADAAEIGFHCNGTELQDGAFFIDLTKREIEVGSRLHQYAVQAPTEVVHLSLPAPATVGDALVALGAHFQCDWRDITLSSNGAPIDNPSALFSRIPGLLRVTRRSEVLSLAFRYGDRVYSRSVEPERVIGDLAPDIRASFELPSDAPIEIKSNGNIVDPRTPVSNCGSNEFEVALPAPSLSPPGEIRIQVGLETEAAPMVTTLSFAPETTLSVVLAAFAAKWRVQYEIDFALENTDTGSRTFPDLAARIDSLDLKNNWLIGTLPRPTEVLVVTTPSSRPPVEEQDDSDGEVLSTCGVRKRKEEASLTAYSFSCEQRDEQFTLSFGRGKNVGDARKGVADHFSLSPEFVTLLHCGKPLKDGFLLDRLRLGRQAIRVYLKDSSEIVLLTGAAMRS